MFHHQAARGVTRFQNQVELLQQARAQFFAITDGLLQLSVRGGRIGAIPFGLRFGSLLLLLSFVACSFGVEASAFGIRLGPGGLLSGRLRVKISAVCFVALVQRFRGLSLGIKPAL